MPVVQRDTLIQKFDPLVNNKRKSVKTVGPCDSLAIQTASRIKHTRRAKEEKKNNN